MTKTVIVLGAKGRFGRAAVATFLNAGWDVRAFARAWDEDFSDFRVSCIAGDAFDAASVSQAADGCDVIVNALNPAYPRWSDELPRITETVIAAAKSSGATIMIPGNVYNFGAHMPTVLTEDSSPKPTTRKGRLRVEMEAAYQDAAQDGVQTIMLRAGDFIERAQTGNWFDSQITKDIGKGNVTYPGPLDRAHAWAYLPDMARAMVQLAEKISQLSMYETFGFAGYTMTGQELIAAMAAVAGQELKVKRLPWSVVRLLGLVSPMMREVAEMAYLWSTPHKIDGSKLALALPEFKATPLSEALRDALSGHALFPMRLASAQRQTSGKIVAG